MFDLITIGDAVIDTQINIDQSETGCHHDSKSTQICFDAASKVAITESWQTLGGNAVNVAAGTAKFGLNTTILTTLGRDATAKMIVSELKKYAVDTSLVQYDPETKTRYSVILNYQSERTILAYHEKRHYVLPKKMLPASWIYYTSVSEGFDDLQEHLIAYLEKNAFTQLVFNPGTFQLKKSLASVREMLLYTDILIVNLEEAEIISGLSFKKAKTISALIHKLLTMGVAEVVITDGVRGSYAGNADEIWHLKTYPITVVAKTGAGDAFSAGYLSAKYFHHDIATALLWGNANSTSVISEHGPQQGLLDQKSVLKMIKKYPAIQPELV